MPAPRDEAADKFSILQKQLILSQVQILELEDVRDELQTEVAHRAKLLSELQALADYALDEARQLRATEADLESKLDALREETRQLQLKIDAQQRDLHSAIQKLTGVERSLNDANAASAAQTARIEVLDAELRQLKASRSWRWSAPLRSIERLFR